MLRKMGIMWLSILSVLHITLLCVYGKPTLNCQFDDGLLSCEGHLPNRQYPSHINTLELYDLEWKELNFNLLMEKFPTVKNITVIRGFVTYLTPPFKKCDIEVLQLKSSRVKKIDANFLNSFTNLKVLNMQENHIKKLDLNISLGNIKNVYLSNNRWNCSEDISWVLKFSENIKDSSKMVCYGEPYSRKPLIAVAEYRKNIEDGCPEQCSCTLPKVVEEITSSKLDPIIEVNCSSRGLTELPSKIPYRTKILRLENNDISNLAILKSNALYRDLNDLYLDNNMITSIEDLEGSYWLKNFRVFSLSGNKLTELPTYALDNALKQNKNMPAAVQMSLGGNPWRCDCVFTPVFKEMLQKYATSVKDLKEVKCSYLEGDDNSLLPILDLSRSSVCRLPSEYSVQEALDLLNAVLASLIIFILGKLAYDYYHFKKTGKLPWIVTKMP